MSYKCKGKCDRLKVSPRVGSSPYDDGLYRCSICDVYINTEGCSMVKQPFCCVCCGARVRQKKH